MVGSATSAPWVINGYSAYTTKTCLGREFVKKMWHVVLLWQLSRRCGMLCCMWLVDVVVLRHSTGRRITNLAWRMVGSKWCGLRFLEGVGKGS